MSSVRPARRRCAASGKRASQKEAALETLLEEFKLQHRDRIASETAPFADWSLPEVLDAVGDCKRPDGTHHPHLHRTPRRARRAAVQALRAAIDELSSARDFNSLHSRIAEKAAPIRGLGAVWVYDAALAIGVTLRLSPDAIYLHAGTARGARLFGIRGECWRPEEWPVAFHASGMSADDLESFLCGYLPGLKRLSAQGRLPKLTSLQA